MSHPSAKRWKPGVLSGKLIIGIVVFGALLVAMFVGSEGLNRVVGERKPPLSSWSAKEKSEYALNRGDWPLATKAFSEMVEQDQFDARSIFLLAYSLEQQGQLKEAKPWYLKSIDYSRFRTWSSYSLAVISANENDADNALKYLTIAIDQQGGHVETLTRSTTFDLLKGRPEFNRLVEINVWNVKKRGVKPGSEPETEQPQTQLRSLVQSVKNFFNVFQNSVKNSKR